jgi:hypothetical protein
MYGLLIYIIICPTYTNLFSLELEFVETNAFVFLFCL